MIYRITWADRLRAFWNRIPAWVIDALLVAVVATCLLLCAGCSDTPPARGSAVEKAADANARAASNARAADKAAIDAAAAKATADALTAEAKAQPTEARIEAAASARVDAAVKEAVAKALDEQSRKATDAARDADAAAVKERIAEAKGEDDRAWTKLCRYIGLIGVAAGALIGGIICYLTKGIAPGAPIGGIIAGTGMMVVAYGSTVAWLPVVLAATVVAGLVVWVIVHLRDKRVGAEGMRTADDAVGTLKALGHTAEAETVKAQAAMRQAKAGIQAQVATSLKRMRPQWAAANNKDGG